MKRWAGLAAGVVLLAVAVGLCVKTFLDERERVEDALGDASVGWLAVGLVLAAATMVVLALGWGRCLAALGAPRRPTAVVGWYFVGELGKYVPGGIWPVVGRGELARRGGVARTPAYQSVVLSLAAWYGAVLFPVAVAVAHPRVQETVARLGRKVSRGRLEVAVVPWRTLVGLLATYLPSWVCIGAMTVAITHAFGESPGWQAPAAAALAWVAGFLAVPVPAGAGVREAVFIATSGLPAGVALTVAVTSRLAFVLVDLVGAVVATPSLRRSERSATPAIDAAPEAVDDEADLAIEASRRILDEERR